MAHPTLSPWLEWEAGRLVARKGELLTAGVPLRWARENGCDWSAEACSCAAQNGHLEILQWLRGNGCPWDAWTCHVAAYFSHLQTLRWAHENGCMWTAATRDKAAAELGYTDDLGNLIDNYGNPVL